LEERHRLIKEEKVKFALEQEKTLFDFDEEIDDLEGVQDRYPGAKKITEPEGEPMAPASKEDQLADREKKQIELAKKFGIKRAIRPALPANVLEDLKKARGDLPTATET